MMDDVDDAGFIAMSVLGILIVADFVAIEIALGLVVAVGVITGVVRYRRGQKWLAFGWVLFSVSVSSLPFISSGWVTLVVFFGGVAVSTVILLFGQIGLIEELSATASQSE
ncbi:hypothetical protein [Haladaptatus sp. DFWS20]|uniref:hypothetical protein n=1 Tax=Haladaptatus sp. DFWS20 TaxID=3403467 RepID=UPI003EB7E0E6